MGYKPNTLSPKEVNILDGKGNPERNGIGQPVEIESGDKPAGFSSGIYKPRGPFIDGDNSLTSN